MKDVVSLLPAPWRAGTEVRSTHDAVEHSWAQDTPPPPGCKCMVTPGRKFVLPKRKGPLAQERSTSTASVVSRIPHALVAIRRRGTGNGG